MSPQAAGPGINGVEVGVLLFFFIAVTLGGFFAARWRRPASMARLDEWVLVGRGFGTLVTWFLLGGDLYTAYTFVAVPAAMYATGAVSGWFAVPYTILVYPLIFVFMPRMWSVAHRRGYVTPADFVRGRYGSRGLSLAIALTGILATMPYIALQLVGIQAVIDTIGLGGSSNAFIKDGLVYIAIIVAIAYVGAKVGFGTMFHAAETKMNTPTKAGKPTGIFIPGTASYWAYGTLAFGSAMALFMYPHAMTATLSSKSRNVIRRNAAILPTYSLMLALLALLGFAAIAKKTSIFGADGFANPQLAVPHFFDQVFPDWFAGVALSAIAIGALVPAAIMSIAAANRFTRNVYREFINHNATPQHEAAVSKIASIVVKFGALAFVLFMDRQNAINLQLLGGVWILQTFIAIVGGLYTRWFHRWALLIAWATAMVWGTVTAYRQTVPNTKVKLVDGKPVTELHGTRHFGASIANFPFTHTTMYIAISALAINIVVAVVLTLVFRALKTPGGADATEPDDYYSDGSMPVGEHVVVRDEPALSA